jgi:nitroimidazol reductase NimA-like FMN-containing flavoprotein (pyridoxamine 5'-phosphate oxidase superfamily)
MLPVATARYTVLIHDLTAEQCREVLTRTNMARLACARANQPYVVPIFFSFDAQDGCLYSFSTLGQKVDWMRGNPKVCLEVEEIGGQHQWTTILVFGRYEEITDSSEHADARRLAHDLFQQRPHWWLPAAAKLRGGEEHQSPVLYRVRIDRVTGRRAGRERP